MQGVGVDVDDGIVIDALELDVEHALRQLGCVHQDAEDVRRTAQGVAVLQAHAPRDLALVEVEILAHPCRTAPLPGMRLELVNARVNMGRIAARHVDEDGRQRSAPPRQATCTIENETAQPRHRGRAVHERQSLLRGQRERLEPCVGECATSLANLTGDPHLPLAHQHGGDIGQRRQIPARTDGASRRNAWKDAMPQERAHGFEQLGSNAGISTGERDEPRCDDGRASNLVEAGPDPAAVIAHEISLQRRGEGRIDRGVPRISEPGGHPIDRVARLDAPLDETGPLTERLAVGRVGIQHGARAPIGDVDHLGPRERLAANHQQARQRGVHASIPRQASSACIWYRTAGFAEGADT
jgi:hypothetical protein